MSDSGDRGRTRRCRFILLAVAFGVLLPVFNPHWITIAVAVAGIALLVFVYLRDCRGTVARDSARPGTHP